MQAAIAANTIVTIAVLGLLVHAVARDPKPVEILHLRQVAMAPADISFEVRLQPEADDREEWALLCDLEDTEPCSLEHHERLSERDIEGELAPRLWSPPPWRHVDAGDYLVVVALGPHSRIRVAATARVVVFGGAP